MFEQDLAFETALERQQNTKRLVAPRRRLNCRERALAAIGDARFGDLWKIDSVIALDVLRPDHAGDDQHAHFRIEPDFLLALDHHIAVGQELGDDRGDVGDQLVGAVDRAVGVALCIALSGDERARQDRLGRIVDPVGAEEIRDFVVFGGGARDLGLILELRARFCPAACKLSA